MFLIFLFFPFLPLRPLLPQQSRLHAHLHATQIHPPPIEHDRLLILHALHPEHHCVHDVVVDLVALAGHLLVQHLLEDGLLCGDEIVLRDD